MDSPDGFHHASVSQLSGAKFSVKGERLLELVGFDTPHKEGLALAQCRHEGVQGALELETKSWRFLTSLCCLKQTKREISQPYMIA